jgi:hypothetical protein
MDLAKGPDGGPSASLPIPSTFPMTTVLILASLLFGPGQTAREPERLPPLPDREGVAWRGAWVVAGGEVRPGIRSPEVWSYSFQAVQP